MAVLKNTTIEDCTITGEVEFYDATIHLDSDQVQHITLKTIGNELQIRNEDDTAFGTLRADSFVGDGSQLTNIDSGPNSTDELSEGTTNLYYSDERVDDRVNTLIQAGTNLSKSYDDSSDTLTLNVDENLSSFTDDVGYLTSVSYTDLIGSPSDVITAGSNVTWQGSTLNVAAGDSNTKIDVGKIRITGTGTVSVTGVGFKPNRIKFEANAPVENYDTNTTGTGNGNQEDNYQGSAFGFARLESDGTTITQQTIHSGGSGNSINTISAYSSSSECLSIRFADQNANEVGMIRVEVQSFDSDGFTLNVLEYSGISNITGLVILFTAARSESLATSATNVSDGGAQVVSSVADINFGSNLTVIDDGDGSVTVSGESGLSLEEVSDQVNTLIQAGNNLTKTYDDSSDTLTLDVESNLSSYNNDVGFITDYSVTQLDVTQYESALTITESQISDLNHFSGSYNDLSDVPTTLSAFTNDVGYLTSVSYTDLTGSPSDVITAGQDLVWNGSTLDHDALHGSELQEITYGENLNQGDPILLYDDSGTVKARKINVTLDYDAAADIQGTDTFNENGEANVTFASDKYIIVSFVKDVNGTNYIGIRIYESDDGVLSLVSETITDVQTNGEIRLVDISDTSFVVSTVHNQTVYVFAGKILSNGSVDTGQKKAADKGDERPALARINETSAVLATSSNSAKDIYLSKIDVSGTSVTVNTASTFGTSTRAASRMWITDLSDTKFIISVSDTRTGSNYGICIVADRSSNTFTFGSKSTFLAEDLGQDYSFATKTLSNAEFVIGYIKNDGSAQVIVNSVSGTSITYGSEQELSPASENNLKINLKSFPDSSSRFLAITSKEPTSGTYEVDVYNGLPDLNNQTVNFGNTPTNLYTDSDNPDYIDICGFASARLVALFESSSGIAKTVSARYFTSDERDRFAGFAGESGSIGEVKPTYLLFQYADIFTGLNVDTFYYLDTSLNLVTDNTGFLVGFSVDSDTLAITKTKSN